MECALNGINKDSNHRSICLKYLQFQYFLNSIENFLYLAKFALHFQVPKHLWDSIFSIKNLIVNREESN